MAGNTATRTYIIKIKFPHIGDYVSYKPDTPSTGYYLKSTQSGYNTDQVIDTSYDPTEWRVMEVDENRNVTKLFGISLKKIGWGGPTGYNNGVYLLNDICKTRYENESLGATARSLNIEDIESRMNSKGIAARNGYKSGTVQYGTTRKYIGSYTKYPALYEQEKYAGVHRDSQGNLVEISDVTDGTQVIAGSVNATAQAKMNSNGKTQSEDVYTAVTTDTSKTDATTLTCTQTYYTMSSQSSYFGDTNFYNMIFGTKTDFWLASRYVNCDSGRSYAYFGLHSVSDSYLYGTDLFFSYGNNRSSNNNRLAPVVFLGSGIQVKSGSGTKDDPFVIGK